MTGSDEGPSPEPLLKKEASQPYWGGGNSGNALEPSNALNYRAWGIPAVLSRGIAGKALRAFPGSFRKFPEFLPESPSRTGGMAHKVTSTATDATGSEFQQAAVLDHSAMSALRSQRYGCKCEF